MFQAPCFSWSIRHWRGTTRHLSFLRLGLTQRIRRVLGGHRGLSGKVCLRLMGAQPPWKSRAPLVSFSCFTYCCGLVSFFFKRPRWNFPERTLFEDLFVVTVFSDHFTEVSLSTTTYFVVEKQILAHLLRVRVPTPSRAWSREVPTPHCRRRPVIPSYPGSLRTLTCSGLFPPSPFSAWNARTIFSDGCWPSQGSSPGHLVLEASACYPPLCCVLIRPLLLFLLPSHLCPSTAFWKYGYLY